jgi:hypothetical protein
MSAMPTIEQPGTPDPEISCRPRSRRATIAVAATVAAAGVATAISATPVMGVRIMFNHNETLVRTRAKFAA